MPSIKAMQSERRWAHKLDDPDRVRTQDVVVGAASEGHGLHEGFDGMCIPHWIKDGLKEAGYVTPSPIQKEAIPQGVLGFDLVVQAKSGTGKTLVFSVISLCVVNARHKFLQPVRDALPCLPAVLILAPTREIAVQVSEVMKSVAKCSPFKIEIQYIIGGLKLSDDSAKLRNCDILVGSPGRVMQLIDMGKISLSKTRLFVLDEADELVSSMKDAVDWIHSFLPSKKQVMAFSATYPKDVAQVLSGYMKNPAHIRLSKTGQALKGLRQFVYFVPYHPVMLSQVEHKMAALYVVVANMEFNQCLVFCRYRSRAEDISIAMCKKGWPANFISANQSQEERLATITTLQDFRCRVLITTDLTARGIDAEYVDVVINFDFPHDPATYLHRMGRAGRFGSLGIAVSLVPEKGPEYNTFVETFLESRGSGKETAKVYELENVEDIQLAWRKPLEEFEEATFLQVTPSETKELKSCKPEIQAARASDSPVSCLGSSDVCNDTDSVEKEHEQGYVNVSDASTVTSESEVVLEQINALINEKTALSDSCRVLRLDEAIELWHAISSCHAHSANEVPVVSSENNRLSKIDSSKADEVILQWVDEEEHVTNTRLKGVQYVLEGRAETENLQDIIHQLGNLSVSAGTSEEEQVEEHDLYSAPMPGAWVSVDPSENPPGRQEDLLFAVSEAEGVAWELDENSDGSEEDSDELGNSSDESAENNYESGGDLDEDKDLNSSRALGEIWHSRAAAGPNKGSSVQPSYYQEFQRQVNAISDYVARAGQWSRRSKY